MYESPITLMVKEMAEQAAKRLDEETFKAIYSVMPTVDKDELIRALQYDRGQYDKGYTDGKRDAMEELVHCKDCKYNGTDDCPMVFEEDVTWDDDGYIEWDRIIHDRSHDDGFCDRGERRDTDG